MNGVRNMNRAQKILLGSLAAALLLGVSARTLLAVRRGGASPVIPALPETTPEPAEVVCITPGGTKYHRQDCTSVTDSDDVVFFSPERALELGYEPCKRCQPGGEAPVDEP